MLTHATARISTRIADAIKRNIAAGSLRPGDRLPPERAMVRRHHVSRVSVREAYRALQDTGIVTVRRGSNGGAFITSPDPSVAGDALAFALRLAEASDRQVQEASLIEPLVAALAARHARRDDLSRLRKLAQADCTWSHAGRFRLHLSRFRLAVADAAHNIALAAVVRSVANLASETHARLHGTDGFVEDCCRRQSAVYDAIATRDADAASERMGSYLLWLDARAGAPVRPPSPGDGLSWTAA